MRFYLLIILCLLTACAMPFGQPYIASARQMNSHEYEVTLKGAEGVSAESLKQYLRQEGSKLCGERVYLLRYLREEGHITISSTEPRSYTLRGEIDCVDIGYFS